MIKPGRNDPCPCGAKDESGKPRKFKRCCLGKKPGVEPCPKCGKQMRWGRGKMTAKDGAEKDVAVLGCRECQIVARTE